MGCPRASWVPYNPFPLWGAPIPPLGKQSLRYFVFFGAQIWAQKVPGPTRAQLWAPGSQIWPWGPKTKKMRAEKPCKTPPPEFQTEAYVASYGQKPFWGKPTRLARPRPGQPAWRPGQYLPGRDLPGLRRSAEVGNPPRARAVRGGRESAEASRPSAGVGNPPKPAPGGRESNIWDGGRANPSQAGIYLASAVSRRPGKSLPGTNLPGSPSQKGGQNR